MKLTLNTFCRFWVSTSWLLILVEPVMPAQLIRISILPNRSATRATALPHQQFVGHIHADELLMLGITDKLVAERAFIQIQESNLCSSFSNLCAITSPRPDAAPVMMATCDSKMFIRPACFLVVLDLPVLNVLFLMFCITLLRRLFPVILFPNVSSFTISNTL